MRNVIWDDQSRCCRASRDARLEGVDAPGRKSGAEVDLRGGLSGQMRTQSAGRGLRAGSGHPKRALSIGRKAPREG